MCDKQERQVSNIFHAEKYEPEQYEVVLTHAMQVARQVQKGMGDVMARDVPLTEPHFLNICLEAAWSAWDLDRPRSGGTSCDQTTPCASEF